MLSHQTNFVGGLKVKKILSVLLVVFLLCQVFTANAQAAGGAPVGGCLPGWELHEFMHHMDGMHQHIGVEQDLNGDGFICVKILSANLHLHLDNTVPIQ
jgi:hypothetical protein